MYNDSIMRRSLPPLNALRAFEEAARAAAEGRRVVLVLGTRGELGEVDEGFLDEGETLRERLGLPAVAPRDRRSTTSVAV